MSVAVAEYLGQRTDVETPVLQPANYATPAQCPFMCRPCDKIVARNRLICSVRDGKDKIWIVCRHRLCATVKDVPISAYQRSILKLVAKEIYGSNVQDSAVLVRREVPIALPVKNTYHADFVMMGLPPPNPGFPSVVLEMQGGGETSNTGLITKHVTTWENNSLRTNLILRDKVKGPGLIVTNAWRRQQEQFLVKGATVHQTGGRIVFCVGTHLFDYLQDRFSRGNLNNLKHHSWSLALLAFCEDNNAPKNAGPIPIIIDAGRQLFTDYTQFVQTLTSYCVPRPEIFKGEFESLSGQIHRV